LHSEAAITKSFGAQVLNKAFKNMGDEAVLCRWDFKCNDDNDLTLICKKKRNFMTP